MVGEMRSAVDTTVAPMARVGYVVAELSSSHDVASSNSRQCQLVDRPVREECSRRLARELAQQLQRRFADDNLERWQDVLTVPNS